MKPKVRYWRNLAILTALSLLLAVAIITFYISDRWSKTYLHPARYIPVADLLIENNIPYQDIELTTSDGVTLSAWYTPPKNGAVILVAHGYNGNRVANQHVMFAKHGYGVLAWDFRAHGLSGGEISTLGYYEQLDVEAALDYTLAQPGVEHIGAWGGSMGAATVILTAADRSEIEAVVADSAFPSLEDVMKLNTFDFMRPFVIFSWEHNTGARVDEVRPVDEIGRISPRPVFIIDGWNGAAVVMNSPYRLYDAAKEPKELWVEDGVPHLNMYSLFPEEYEERVQKFFDENLKDGQPAP
jgi:fermentation-respiration switch protein FrsA (DUF1100 family)